MDQAQPDSAVKPPRLALVTGGCRRLGAAISGALAQAGYSLALHGFSNIQPEDWLVEDMASLGTDWHGFLADLEHRDATQNLMDQVVAHFGRAPDVLINNASLFDYDDWETLGSDSLTRHFQTNLHAPLLLSKALVQASGERTQPVIINIVDQRVNNPNGDQLAYTLSKQALAESIRTMARAFGARARVNGVAPGLTIATKDYSAAQMQRLADDMPLGRLSLPSDIADAVLYLAHAKAVTGQLIFVDGGAHMLSYDRDFVFMQQS